MKKKLLVGLVTGLFLAGMVGVASATALYITGTSEPWGNNSNINNMNAAFGAGNWDQFTFTNAITSGALSGNNYNYIYIDGGDGQTSGFMSFVNNNRNNLENWVAAGGSLFLNAARWSNTSDFDLGFDTILHYGTSNTGTAIDPNHDIFDANTGTSWSGTFFSHDYITGNGLTGLINGTSGWVLAEKDYGTGLVMFGGMTNTNFHSPSDSANALRVNIHQYGANHSPAPVPEPATMLLFGTGLAGLVGMRRKKSRK